MRYEILIIKYRKEGRLPFFFTVNKLEQIVHDNTTDMKWSDGFFSLKACDIHYIKNITL